MNEILKKWDLTKVEKEFKLIKEHNKFAILDIETTGFNPEEGAEIIQIAGCIVVDGKIANRIAFFVKPERAIPEKITEITGITNDDVRNGFTLSAALCMVKAFIEDAVVVCHNAKFDWDTFLKPLMEKFSINVDNEVVCTFQTFYRSIPELGKGAYTNEKMASIFGFELANAHQADADVEATTHSLMGLKQWFDTVDFEVYKEEKEKEEEAFSKIDTPVEVESVNFWGKTFDDSRKMLRHYVRVRNEDGRGTVFYDIIEKVWKNKDFPKRLNFKSVERDTLNFLGLKSVQDLEGYRN